MGGLLGRRLNPVTAWTFGAFAVHQECIAIDQSWPLADAVLDPLCAIPLMLGIPSHIARFFQPLWRLPWGHTLAFTAFTAVIFEALIPRYDPRFTADLLDVAAYTLGAAAWRLAEPMD